MNSLSRLIAALILGIGLAPTCALHADSHGHIIHRDHDGNCLDDEDTDEDNDCDSESDDSDDEEHHAWAHHHHNQKEIEAGYEDEDLSYQLEEDTSWPSKKENFSEMFR